MNNISANNYLVFCSINDTSPLLQFCLDYLHTSHCNVLFVTEHLPNLLDITPNITKSILERWIIMQYTSIAGITQKLFVLHEWGISPSVVVLDLRSYVTKMQQDSAETQSMLQCICLCIASLFSYMDSLLPRSEAKAQQRKTPYSVMVLPREASFLTRNQLDLLINLYYYNNKAFNDLKDLREMLEM